MYTFCDVYVLELLRCVQLRFVTLRHVKLPYVALRYVATSTDQLFHDQRIILKVLNWEACTLYAPFLSFPLSFAFGVLSAVPSSHSPFSLNSYPPPPPTRGSELHNRRV